MYLMAAAISICCELRLVCSVHPSTGILVFVILPLHGPDENTGSILAAIHVLARRLRELLGVVQLHRSQSEANVALLRLLQQYTTTTVLLQDC